MEGLGFVRSSVWCINLVGMEVYVTSRRIRMPLVALAGLLLVVLVSMLALPARRARANDIGSFAAFRNTKMAAAGYGGIRRIGEGTITLSGVNGTVTQAFLYWHGPTNSSDSSANATVTFAGRSVTGEQIGFSDDNCWDFQNSQAYRADVTALVTGNGSYTLKDFRKGNAEINGASLIVFFNDSDATTNRDFVLFDGNDSNINNPFDANGWNVTLPGITYTSGQASISLHVSDGQASSNFADDALILNGNVLAPRGQVFSGDSVPNGPSASSTSGGLWDIKSYDITSALSPGNNTLRLTTGQNSDCLSLIVAVINLPAGAAPPVLPPRTPPTTPPADDTRPADPDPALISVAQMPVPNHAVAPGNRVVYTIEVVNHGRGRAKEVTVLMPFNPGFVRVVDASFTSPKAWVSSLGNDFLEFRTGPIASGGDILTATIRLEVAQNAPVATSLAGRLSFDWADSAGGGKGRSNLTILAVGAADDNRPFYSSDVSPSSGPNSARRSLSSPIFVPFEPVAFWYNLPNRQVEEAGILRADENGLIDAAFTPVGLGRNTYQIVVYGNWSRMTTVGNFTVDN